MAERVFASKDARSSIVDRLLRFNEEKEGAATIIELVQTEIRATRTQNEPFVFEESPAHGKIASAHEAAIYLAHLIIEKVKFGVFQNLTERLGDRWDDGLGKLIHACDRDIILSDFDGILRMFNESAQFPLLPEANEIETAIQTEAAKAVANLRQTGDESGHREEPAADDPTAYRPASELIDEQFPTIKAIKKALDENPSIRWRRPTGKNGKPIPNRLNIHAGDWQEFKKNRPRAIDPLDLPALVVDAVMETEKRKAETRNKAGK